MVRSIQRKEVFMPGAVPIAANEVPAYGGIPEHTHEFLELAIVSAGSGVNVTRDQEVPISLGSVILIRPGTWHAYREPRDLQTFNLYIAPELFQRELSWVLQYRQLSYAFLRGNENLGSLSPETTNLAIGWLEQIRLLRNGEHAPRLIGLASCVIDAVADASSIAFQNLDGTIATAVVSMMNLMQQDLAARWTIGDLAHHVSASPALVHRYFKAYVGMPPMAWLLQARGEAAATLLVLSAASIAEIGRSVGWPDPNYASRRFRSLYGITPSEYRKRFSQERPTPLSRHSITSSALSATSGAAVRPLRQRVDF